MVQDADMEVVRQMVRYMYTAKVYKYSFLSDSSKIQFLLQHMV